jgi:hypothetical protein
MDLDDILLLVEDDLRRYRRRLAEQRDVIA